MVADARCRNQADDVAGRQVFVALEQPEQRQFGWMPAGLDFGLDERKDFPVRQFDAGRVARRGIAVEHEGGAMRQFDTAGGEAATLMTTHAATLAAISAGAVFMGANTYIGNAPNLMVKAIAEDRGVKMPSFFGYMLWSGGILVPLFIVMTFIWFR
jgi:hypothetical protein